MDNIGTILQGRLFPEKSRKVSERGELLKHFSTKLGRPIPSFTWKLQGLSVQDLYYIKSVADDYERGGNPWGKAFWGMLRNK